MNLILSKPSHKQQLDRLVEKLYYLGASKQFSIELGELVQGRPFNRNFVSRYRNGELNFSGKLNNYLREAISIAEGIVSKEAGREIVGQKIMFDEHDMGKFVEDSVLQFESKGDIQFGLQNLPLVYHRADPDKLYAQNEQLFFQLHFSLSSILMQYGGVYEKIDPMQTIAVCEQLVRYDFNLLSHEEVFRVLNLKGHLLRQHNRLRLQESLDLYYFLEKEINHWNFSTQKREELSMFIKHQLGINLHKMAVYRNDQRYAIEAKKYFADSNQYFKDHSETKWNYHTQIREAENLVECGEYDKADKLLAPFESIILFNKLDAAKKTIFFRIRALFYLRLGEFASAEPYLNEGIRFAKEHDFKEQIELMELMQAQLGKS